MRNLFYVLFFLLGSCNGTGQEKQSSADSTAADTSQHPSTVTKDDPGKETEEKNEVVKDTSSPSSKTYANRRFRNVTVKKLGEGRYQVQGEGQIFEANFGWVVEDGHNELLQGHQMTDNGAPAWGKFSFTIEPKKHRENSSLTLILFEVSAKDGSRVHELAIPLG